MMTAQEIAGYLKTLAERNPTYPAFREAAIDFVDKMGQADAPAGSAAEAIVNAVTYPEIDDADWTVRQAHNIARHRS